MPEGMKPIIKFKKNTLEINEFIGKAVAEALTLAITAGHKDYRGLYQQDWLGCLLYPSHPFTFFQAKFKT